MTSPDLSHLLPANSSKWERCLADACALPPAAAQAADSLPRLKFLDRPADFLPWLADEYGLAALTPYLPNLYDLLDKGVLWTRRRGAAAAIAQALGWLGLQAELRQAPAGRNWWNAYGLYFAELPASADLARIEGLMALSACLRSDFRRGVCGYDAPAFAGDETKADNALADTDSGFAARQTIWSFARTYEFAHELTELEGKKLGIWIAPNEAGLKWGDAHFPWDSAEYPWADYSAGRRAQIMTQWFDGKRPYLCFYAGEVILGYRACRVCRACAESVSGAYKAFQTAYEPSLLSGCVYIEAMTGFGDASICASRRVTRVSLIFAGEPAAHIPPGRLWLRPGELSGGTEIAGKLLAIDLRRAVREQIKIVLKA